MPAPASLKVEENQGSLANLIYFYRSLSEEDISNRQDRNIEKHFQSAETQTEESENSLDLNIESEGSDCQGRILYGTSREIRNIYCKNYDRPPTFREIKLFSYKRKKLSN